MPLSTLADPLAAAIDLLPQVRAARDELEELRHIPTALARAIGDAGLFQLYLPSAIGGAETPPLRTFRVIEEFSKAEGSVGWCVMIANSVTLFTGWLAPEGGMRNVWAAAGGAHGRLGAAGRQGVARGRRLPGDRSVEFRQRRASRQLAVLHLQSDGRRHAAAVGKRGARHPLHVHPGGKRRDRGTPGRWSACAAPEATIS